MTCHLNLTDHQVDRLLRGALVGHMGEPNVRDVLEQLGGEVRDGAAARARIVQHIGLDRCDRTRQIETISIDHHAKTLSWSQPFFARIDVMLAVRLYQCLPHMLVDIGKLVRNPSADGPGVWRMPLWLVKL